MPRYTKRPVEIEAIPVYQLNQPGDYGGYDLPEWVRDAMHSGVIEAADHGGHFFITTLEGVMIATPTSFIVRGVQGELYPVAGDIFRQTYDPVTERHPS